MLICSRKGLFVEGCLRNWEVAKGRGSSLTLYPLESCVLYPYTNKFSTASVRETTD